MPPLAVGSTYPCFAEKHRDERVFFDTSVPRSVYILTALSCAITLAFVGCGAARFK